MLVTEYAPALYDPLYDDMYITQRHTGDEGRNLDTSLMSVGYPEVVKSRVSDMMNKITNGRCPSCSGGRRRRRTPRE